MLRYILALVMISSGLCLADDAKIARIKRIIKTKKCHNTILFPLQKYLKMKNYWLENDESKYNIVKNFNDLQAKNEKYFKYLRKFQRTTLETPDDLKDLQKALLKLDKRHVEVIRQLSSISVLNEKFIVSLRIIEYSLQAIKDEFSKVSPNCSGKIQAEIRNINKDLDDWTVAVAEMKNFVVKTRKKRVGLFSLVLNSLKMELNKRYTERATDALADMGKTIDNIFKAGELLQEVIPWYFSCFLGKDGIASDLHLGYLYATSLRRLEVYYAKALEYKKRADALKLPQFSKEILDAEVNMYVKSFAQMIEGAKKDGWEYYFRNQMESLERKKGKLARLDPRCGPYLEIFEEKAKKVVSPETYELAEPAYHDIYRYCKLRKRR